MIVMEPGPLVSGRLHLQVIERARMLLYQFYGAVNEETTVNVSDLYSCLYDRDLNKEEDRRSTLINFRQTMLDVEYIKPVVGPSNEIKIWTLVIGTSTKWFRFQENRQTVNMSSNMMSLKRKLKGGYANIAHNLSLHMEDSLMAFHMATLVRSK